MGHVDLAWNIVCGIHLCLSDWGPEISSCSVLLQPCKCGICCILWWSGSHRGILRYRNIYSLTSELHFGRNSGEAWKRWDKIWQTQSTLDLPPPVAFPTPFHSLSTLYCSLPAPIWPLCSPSVLLAAPGMKAGMPHTNHRGQKTTRTGKVVVRMDWECVWCLGKDFGRCGVSLI